MEYHTLIFDLDGTISNPSKGISRSINFALASQGYDKINEDIVSQYIGPPLDWTFRTLAPDADEAKVALLVSNYRKRYRDVGYSENRLYDGIVDALKTLNSNGYRLGLCTSKRGRLRREDTRPLSSTGAIRVSSTAGILVLVSQTNWVTY